MNAAGAINVIDELAQEIEDNGYADYTELDADRRELYEDAWEDFKYWGQLMANVFSKEVAGLEDSMAVEVETGTDENGDPVVESKEFGNPHGASSLGVDSADLPDRPNGGGS
jgi:hypothetical protein